MRVVVKWNKETHTVELDPSKPVLAFKEALYALTGVPVARQKLMGKKLWKGTLKDNVDLSACPIAEGANIMLMGSSTGIPERPKEATVFVEDMTAADAAKAGAVLPAGLVNLGNTCYMNSTLECLRYVPELRESLKAPTPGGAGAGGSTMATSLRDLYGKLDLSTESQPPAEFWMRLRMEFPQFGETNERGAPRQQDSEEFQSVLMTSLAQRLTTPTASLPTLFEGNAIDALFGLEFEVTMKCAETDAEPPSVMRETTRKLVCNIDGGAGKMTQINHMHEGIELGLLGEVEKASSILGRNAVFRKEGRISRLPKYLCVQFMRFYWKATPESRDHAGVKCKMLRPVTFPADNFDVFQFCSPALQAKLQPARDRAIAELEAEEEARKKGDVKPAAAPAAAGDGDAAMGEDDDELAAALALSMGDASAAAAGAGDGPVPPLGPGFPADFQGLYEMYAVVTHKGRSADAGHYMGWVRESGDDWLCFDDDEVSPCKTEDITRLKGGGDYHMASVVFYRAKK